MIIDVELYFNTHLMGRSQTLDDLLATQSAAGITHSILMPAGPQPTFDDNVSIGRALVDRADATGCAWLNIHSPDAPRQLEMLVHDYGFASIKLMPVHGAFRVVSAVPNAVMEKARELKIPVTIHSGNFFCYPLEIGVLAGRFPDVPVLMDHMGYRYWVAEAIEAAKAYPNIYLVTTAVMEPHFIWQAVKELGPERVVFGSNAPMVPPQVQVDVVKLADLGDAAERKIFYENAARLHGMA